MVAEAEFAALPAWQACPTTRETLMVRVEFWATVHVSPPARVPVQAGLAGVCDTNVTSVSVITTVCWMELATVLSITMSHVAVSVLVL